MNNEQLTAYLQDESYLYTLSYEELKTLVVQYPYASNLRVLLLKKSYIEQNKDYERNLQMAAAYSTNRRFLYKLIKKLKTLQAVPANVILGEDYLELTNLSNVEKLRPNKYLLENLVENEKPQTLRMDFRMDFEAPTHTQEDDEALFDLSIPHQNAPDFDTMSDDEVNLLVDDIVSKFIKPAEQPVLQPNLELSFEKKTEILENELATTEFSPEVDPIKNGKTNNFIDVLFDETPDPSIPVNDFDDDDPEWQKTQDDDLIESEISKLETFNQPIHTLSQHANIDFSFQNDEITHSENTRDNEALETESKEDFSHIDPHFDVPLSLATSFPNGLVWREQFIAPTEQFSGSFIQFEPEEEHIVQSIVETTEQPINYTVKNVTDTVSSNQTISLEDFIEMQDETDVLISNQPADFEKPVEINYETKNKISNQFMDIIEPIEIKNETEREISNQIIEIVEPVQIKNETEREISNQIIEEVAEPEIKKDTVELEIVHSPKVSIIETEPPFATYVHPKIIAQLSFSEWLKQFKKPTPQAVDLAEFKEPPHQIEIPEIVDDSNHQTHTVKDKPRKLREDSLKEIFEKDFQIPENLFGFSSQQPPKPVEKVEKDALSLNTNANAETIMDDFLSNTDKINNKQPISEPLINAPNDSENVEDLIKKKKKKKVMHELAAKSLESDNDIVSETLADILAAQGIKDRAIEMYRRLSLQIPEKSAFFAAKIEKLRTTM